MREMRVAGLVLVGCLLSSPVRAWSEPECHAWGESFICGVGQAFWQASERRRQFAYLTLIKKGADAPVIGLGIADAAWRMPWRQGLTVKVGVDGGERKDCRAATDKTEVHVYLPLDELQSLADGARLHVELPDATFQYSLRGSKAAIQALSRAFDDHARQADPFRSARPQVPEAAPGQWGHLTRL